MEKEIKINVPEGYEIDKENSTFECIKFKPVVKGWRYNEEALIKKGAYITAASRIITVNNNFNEFKNLPQNYNIFATEAQAKSSLAMARISQIMANDKRFGGAVTDDEWACGKEKYSILRTGNNNLIIDDVFHVYGFLTFRTLPEAELFLKENEDLIRDYYML